MIIRPRELLADGMPDARMLRSVLQEHLTIAKRLHRLRAYYDGDAPILERKRTAGLPNNRLAHPIARYIANITSGYLVGHPVGYAAPEANKTLEAIQAAFKRMSISAIDSENARNAAIYGKGVEYIFMVEGAGGKAEPMISALSPEQAFVVYDDTHRCAPLFGVYYTPRRNADGDFIGYNLWVMNDRVIRHATANDGGFAHISADEDDVEHYFGGVPLVEYWNSDNEKGDYEGVLTLIDAYDLLQSDRMNDKQQFVDALLVLTGCTLDVDDKGRSPGQQLREDKALSLPDADARAEYLTNTLHEADIDILRKALCDDIHKYAMVPNLADDQFAGNSSGVALKYKLMGLEYLTAMKEQWFREGLRARLKLIAHVMGVAGEAALDVSEVEISMPRSMPSNLQEVAQIAQMASAAGAASTDTLVKLMHDDWGQEAVDAEAARIKLESDGAFNRRMELYNARAISRAELRAQSLGEEQAEAEAAVGAISEGEARTDGIARLLAQPDGEA